MTMLRAVLSVRKASVFCIVAIHQLLGETAIQPHLECLNGSKMKLLSLYIKRAQAQSNAGKRQIFWHVKMNNNDSLTSRKSETDSLLTHVSSANRRGVLITSSLMTNWQQLHFTNIHATTEWISDQIKRLENWNPCDQWNAGFKKDYVVEHLWRFNVI